ncbi:unnamed protein product, partial [marine sediment metagenome]
RRSDYSEYYYSLVTVICNINIAGRVDCMG